MKITKKTMLVAVGFTPLLTGFALDFLVTKAFPSVSFPYNFINVLFFGVCFFGGVKLSHWGGTPTKATLLVSIPGFVLMGTLIYQSSILMQFSTGIIGTASQLYFLPALSIAGIITMSFKTMTLAYIASFALMAGFFYSGCKFNNIRISK